MSPKCKFNIVRPSDSSYSKYRRNYNLAIDYYPTLIALCCNEQDIIKSLKFAKDHNLDFRIRGNRHDFEGNSNLNCGLIIDLSKINYVDVNEFDESVTVGGGASLKDVYTKLVTKGFTIPAGTCSDVGAIGLATSAGFGYAARYLGLTLDNILEITLINAKFEKILVNANTNWDLFWAIKGSQPSSFGVITEIKFKIHKVENISYFKSTWYVDNSVELINTFQNFAFTVDERLTMNLILSKEYDNTLNLNINGQFFGSKDELKTLISPLLKVAKAKSIIIDTVSYEKVLETWNEECLPPNNFKNSGSFLYENLNADSINTLLDFIEKAPNGLLHSIEILALGGKILSFPNNSSVFPHRYAHYLLQIKSIWQSCHNIYLNKYWTNNFKNFLDTVGVGTYRGFTDFNILNWPFQYFGYNYDILREVKSKYDPENFFKFYQSVQPLNYDISKLTGDIITPHSPNYDEVKKVYNTKLNNCYPIAIVYPHDFNDVKNSVLFAKKNYVNIGLLGSIYDSNSFNSYNYSIVLNMSSFKYFKFNDYSNTVTISSGITSNELYEKVYNLGYQFIDVPPNLVIANSKLSDDKPDFSSSEYSNLPINNLSAVKFIDNDGTLIITNNTLNSNLFFAIKDYKKNIGIILELTFKVKPIKKLI